MDKIVSYTTSELVNKGLLGLMHDYFYTLLQIFYVRRNEEIFIDDDEKYLWGRLSRLFCLPPELYCTGIQSYLFFTHFSVQLSNL